MRYTKAFVKERIAEVEREIQTIDSIVWCETFECNEYSRDELRALSLLKDDYQGLLHRLRYLQEMQG